MRTVLKRAAQLAIGLLSTLLLFFLLVLLQSVNPEQDHDQNRIAHFPVRPSLEANAQQPIDSLLRHYGSNKVLPPGYEQQALLALSAYPELASVAITFELTIDSAPMEATFDYATLLGRGRHRAYRILLNDGHNAMEPILLRNLPFDAQVGILAHELGHVAYYHKHSSLQLAKWGLSYLWSEDFRARHERSTDMAPVYRGLGWQILAYALYVRTDASTRPFYEQYGAVFMDKFYHTPAEIKAEMQRLAVYGEVAL